ncbi:MAG: DUF4347 domain-containing protein, partial [Gammaproteobacteria bacterium]|nr:DUF4347 domain-containing protein [Gammaproteobacteria bacterium]
MLKRKNKAPKSKRKSPVVESLEPRILMSADLPGLDAALPSEDGVEDTDTDKVIADAQAAFRQQQDAQPSPTGEPADDDDIATAFVSDAAATRHELVIVGPHVPDHQQLLADIEARTAADTQIDVVVLDADTDSVDQLSAVFARYSDLDAVHVLSHGSDGAIHIGDDTLDLAAVQRHADAIRAWGDALTADGDLLIYGCDLAASATGEALVDALATLTGADVAASDDRTGHASQGGDWDFEYTTGNIETDDPFSDGLQADYDEVLATYSVTNTNDSGAGSLRQAILDANANTGTDTIDFNISGTGVHTINLTSPLPTINETITIDGSSDDSYAANGSQPAVVLDGSSAGAGANGLVFDAGSDGSTLRGLAVVNFDGVGVLLTNSGGHTVAGNYIGTDGSSDLGNGSWGLEITNSANNVVGGTTSADRNVISGNGVGGITFWGAGSTNNTVIGNYIGTDANGNAGIGNTADGIAFGNGASSNTIGGSADGERNVIAGNGNDGIELNHSGTNNNSIIGNYIGTSADGSADLGNARHGVVIYDGVQGTQVSGNVISGNGQYGVLIDGNSGSGTENNTLTGNYIGTDFTGTVAIGNDAGGVYLFNGANGNVIGGTGVGDGNLVAFNGGRGIELTSGAGSGNQLLGNTVTQNVASGVYSYADGTEIIGNVVYNNSTGFSYDEVVLGSNQTVYHNTIHGAKDDGISVEGSSAIIRNNIITGSAGYGIRIAGGSISTESYNLITDAVTGPANLGGRANFALDASDLNDDPLYRDSANGDFRLTSPTSPAIDAGLDFGLTQPDVNGADAGKYGGTAPDIGTLEIWAPVSNPPTDLQAVSAQSGGLSLNSDGGNDAYVIADDGGAIMGGLTALTAEIRFSSTANADTQPLLTYATATTDKELSILLHDSGDLRLWLAESSAHSSAIDYRSLADGDAHTLSFSWDNGSGDWAIYVDGAVVDSGTGLASGQTLDGGGAIVFGQDQDSLDGGYSSTQVFDGTLYDARIFSDARTASEIAASYASELVYDEQGMLANWRFDNLSTDGVVTDTVSGNNLTVQHASGTGFTTSTPTLTFAVDDNAADGSVVGSVAGTDPERDVLIASLLASESNLRYNAETGKFYEIVGGAHFWGDARTAAESSTLNGVSGQLVTIRSAAENAFLTDLVNSTIGYSVWIGATDATVEGEWRWVDGGSEADLFWLGDENGSNPAGVYHNFAAGQPNDVGNNEDVARLDTNGTWLDGDHDNHDYYGYIIEWNADDVLDNAGPVDEQPLTYTIASQTVAGAFAINADSGQVSVANGSLLDASANATHTVTVRVTDVDGNTYDEAFTIALTSTAPTDLLSVSTQSGGLSLNEDGGNDAYLIADDGGAIFGGMTALTAEVRFAMDAFPNSTNFFSYATSGDDNVVKFNIRDNGDLSFAINSNYAFSSAMDYRTLADGDPHTLSVTWDSSGGLWEMFVDGASVDSGSGLQSGATLAGGGTLVMGNDQDSVDGGYDTTSEAAATLYDAR